MVDEFAAFARIPKPVMELADIRDAVQDSVVLFREAHPKLEYKLELPREKVFASIDRRLITQAVTNLVKNATESVESAAEVGDRPEDWKGRIITRVRPDETRVYIEVIDNGSGLPKQQRSRLLEPYVTTKGHKGTGLGLAMVLKITEQHGGSLTLEDAPNDDDGKPTTGALVRITLPLEARPVGTSSNSAASAHGDAGSELTPSST